MRTYKHTINETEYKRFDVSLPVIVVLLADVMHLNQLSQNNIIDNIYTFKVLSALMIERNCSCLINTFYIKKNKGNYPVLKFYLICL